MTNDSTRRRILRHITLNDGTRWEMTDRLARHVDTLGRGTATTNEQGQQKATTNGISCTATTDATPAISPTTTSTKDSTR